MLRSRSSRLAVSAVGLAALAGALVAQPAAGAGSATGSVFFINPVQSTGIQTLVDDNDSATSVPAQAYRTVTLPALDGSGYLVGQWANVLSETGPRAYSATGSFAYDRADDRFEQVMAYYWVTQAQLYLQRIGFTGQPGGLPAVNKESQDVRINQWGQDNSYSWDKHDVMRFGKGGVDDAEDGEVIVHEYGHAVHDSQVVGFGLSLDAGSIGEAFGDYLAVTVGLAVAGPPATGAPAACVMDWDATSYTSRVPHCLRRIDLDLTVADRRNEVHFDGQIWSRALWDIRNGIKDPVIADRIIINAQFGFAPDTSFEAAALETVQTAAEMYPKSRYADIVRTAFRARGILR